MKYYKRIIALALCLMMLFALCACSDASTIKGDWQASADMTYVISKELKLDFHELSGYFSFENLFVTVSLSLDGDDTYKLSLEISDASLEKIENAVESAAEDYVEGYYEEAADMLGLDLEGLRAMYKSQGMDLDTEMADAVKTVTEECDVESAVAEILSAYESEGSWSIENGKLSLTDGEGNVHGWEYENLSGDGFTVSAGTDEMWKYPLSFTEA